MSFFDLSSGETLNRQQLTGNFEMGGQKLAPIPDGTQVKAMIDDVKWETDFSGENSYINIKWAVMAPEDYRNRVIFQKLWVLGNNPNKPDAQKAAEQGDKAKRMLAAIDLNASGGKMLESGQTPTDADLMANLASSAMLLKLGHWQIEGNDGMREGNWVMSVSPLQSGQPQQPQQPAQPAQQQQSAPADQSWDDGEDIPF